MHIRTVSITVAAAHDAVFHFLADLENLPRWATEFCERLELRQGAWWAYTSQGELLVEADVSAGAGTIDLRLGPAPGRLTPFPLRVVPVGARRTLVTFTLIQPEGQPDEHYETHYRSLLLELRGLIRRFGGGELHAFEPTPLAAPGWN